MEPGSKGIVLSTMSIPGHLSGPGSLAITSSFVKIMETLSHKRIHPIMIMIEYGAPTF